MRLMIDANILLDVLMQRTGFYRDSSLIWKLCETRQAQGLVSVLTFANLVYIMRKELSPAQIRSVREQLSLIFTFALSLIQLLITYFFLFCFTLILKPKNSE